MILFARATKTADDMSVETIVEECSERKMESALKRTWKASELRRRYIQSEYLHARCIARIYVLVLNFPFYYYLFFFVISLPGYFPVLRDEALKRRIKSRLLNISVTSEAITKVRES